MGPEMRVAFVTSRNFPLLTADDHVAVKALAARDIAVTPAIWDDLNVAWPDYDALVLRSTWDYHDHLERFIGWLAYLEVNHVQAWNAPHVVKWNADKTYLAGLVGGPIAVPPTEFVGRKSSVSLAARVKERGWQEVVIKPTVSADGHGVHRFTRMNLSAGQDRLDDILETSGAMIQQFIPSVERAGETSLMFFDGAFSHAVKRLPASREYRVQERFGGQTEPHQPGAALVERCAALMTMIGFDCLYARVDVVETPDGPLLMEVELIEPSLYFGSTPGAVDRFADALVRRLASGDRGEPRRP